MRAGKREREGEFSHRVTETRARHLHRNSDQFFLTPPRAPSSLSLSLSAGEEIRAEEREREREGGREKEREARRI